MGNKILITMKLSDKSLKYHIYPATLCSNCKEILIVRDKKGPEMAKVKYLCPPLWILKFRFATFIYKFFLLISLSIREKPSLILGFLLYPHGILALLVGKLTCRKAAVYLIAGPVELYKFAGSPIEKYSYVNKLPDLSIIGKLNLNTLKNYEIILVAGSLTKKFLLEKGISEKIIKVIPYAIIDNRFRQIQMKKEFDLIYVGRLTAVKHNDIILRVTYRLKYIFGISNIKTAIVGNGQLFTNLKKLSKELKIENNVKFLGFQENIAHWLNLSKLSILTSERETGPFSILESMMCGVPVISSRCSDTVIDLLKNHENGIIINKYNDVQSYTVEIIKLLKNPSLLNKYSNNAIHSVNKIKIANIQKLWNKIFE